MLEPTLFETEKKERLRLKGKFATQKQIDKDKETKRVDFVMRQNSYLKEENEMLLRMVSAMRIHIRTLNEKLSAK